MGLKSIAFGFVLVFVVLGAFAALPASAQASSAFSFTLQGSSAAACWYYGVSFGATEGQQVTVQWSENQSGIGPVSMDFYIAPLTSIQQVWSCDGGPVNLYWNDGAYGTANLSAPSTAAYAALVVNYSQYPVSGTFSITTPNGTLSPTAIGPSTARREVCVAPSCLGS